MVDNNLFAVALFRRLVKLRVGIQGQLQDAFVTAAEHGQRAVRRDGSDRLVVIEVVAEFCPFLFFAAHHRGNQVRILPQVVTHLRQQRGVFSKALHQDITRAIQCGFGIGDAFIGIDKLRGFCFRIVGRFVP